MSKINDFIKQARKELLDLSGRNKLINFKLPKARGIQISNSAEEIYNVIQNKEIILYPAPEEEDEKQLTPKSQIQLIKNDAASEKPLRKVKKEIGLNTEYDFKTLERRVKKTGGEARAYIEERGVNVLYLAIGFLNWFEERDKEKIFSAPLALIPITLKVSQDKKTFSFHPLEEEDMDLRENITLRTKIENDFNVIKPDAPIFGKKNIYKIFKNENYSKKFDLCKNESHNKKVNISNYYEGVDISSFYFLSYKNLNCNFFLYSSIGSIFL